MWATIPVKKAAAIHEIVESIALVPDHGAALALHPAMRALAQINEQALISEMNKVLRKQYRKKLGDDQPVPEELIPTEIAPPQPTLEDVGTTPQERDLLRMLLSYGHERINVPFHRRGGQHHRRGEQRGRTHVRAPRPGRHPLRRPALPRDLPGLPPHQQPAANRGCARYVGHEQEAWRSTAIDLLTEKHVLSPNWKDRHKIHVKRESEQLFDASKRPWTS
jgi:DNA primase